MSAAPHLADLTVAIATRDRPEALARCLDALLAGTILPAEIVVVDQGRDDAGEQIVQARAAAPTRIVYVAERGLSVSRNVGIARATSTFVAVTDDDCVPDPEWVGALSRTFATSDGPDVVTGRVLPLGPARPGFYAVSTRAAADRAEFRGPTFPWLAGTGANTAAARSWFARVGPYDDRLGAGTAGGAGEDMDILYRFLRAGARVWYEPGVLIYHERQSRARRRASRIDYGRGIGALAGLWLRRRDPFAARLLGHWVFDHGWALAGALRRGRWEWAGEEGLMLFGTARGLLYGLRLRKDGGV